MGSRLWSGIVFLVASLVMSGSSDAQSIFNRPVRLVVAAAPGGNPDVLARALAQKLSETTNTAFVVENLPGSGGVVAAQSVAKATPDGSVLMLGDSGALAISLATTPGIPYQPLRDFTPITALASVPTVLVVTPATQAKALADFVRIAKEKPRRLNYGSAGIGSVHHLTMAVFAARAGLQLEHIAYRGGSAMIDALLKGEVQAGWSGIPNVLEPVRLGTLVPLAVSTIERQKTMPDIPTLSELGFEGFDIATMMGLQGPAGMPKSMVEKLQSTLAKVLREPEMVERMTSLGMVMAENGTDSYVQFMKDDIGRYAKAAHEAGITAK